MPPSGVIRKALRRVLCACAVVVFCTMKAGGGVPAEDMRRAAAAWLEAAGPLQSKAVHDVNSAERTNWGFVPKSRKGASLAEMNEKQRKLVHELLQTALSHRGFLQATRIVDLEVVLRELEGNDYRDPGRYFLTIFGTPASDSTWGWRFEGHHLSLNFLVAEGQNVAVAPSFFGSNPAESQKEGQTVRPLAEEEEIARALAKSLDPEQRKQAVFSDAAPRDIITGARRSVEPLEPRGIGFEALKSEQQDRLKHLVSVYLNRYRSELAKEDLQRIESAGWQVVSFAWAGGLEKGHGHYYRVQGRTFLLEYDNTQNRANHIHTVWRDFERDFGGDLLQEHYRTSGHHDQDRELTWAHDGRKKVQ